MPTATSNTMTAITTAASNTETAMPTAASSTMTAMATAAGNTATAMTAAATNTRQQWQQHCSNLYSDSNGNNRSHITAAIQWLPQNSKQQRQHLVAIAAAASIQTQSNDICGDSTTTFTEAAMAATTASTKKK